MLFHSIFDLLRYHLLNLVELIHLLHSILFEFLTKVVYLRTEVVRIALRKRNLLYLELFYAFQVSLHDGSELVLSGLIVETGDDIDDGVV